MNKRGVATWLKVLLVILLIVAILLSIVVLVLLILNMNSNPEDDSLEKERVILENPIKNLNDTEAQAKINKTFVEYLLYSIDADELHKPPLSSDTPKINLEIGNDLDYGAEISRGEITVKESQLSTPDIIIITTRSEAIKMLRQKSYISQSFNSGASQIELVASKTKLFSKGYLDLYTELTGEEAPL